MISVTSMPKASRLYQIVLSLPPVFDSEDVSVFYFVRLPACKPVRGVWRGGTYVGSPEVATGVAIDEVVYIVAGYLYDQASEVSQIVMQGAGLSPQASLSRSLENMDHTISTMQNFLEQVKKDAERRNIPTEYIERHINDFNTLSSLVGQIRNSIDQRTGEQEQPSLKETLSQLLSQLLEELNKTMTHTSSDLGARQSGVVHLSGL